MVPEDVLCEVCGLEHAPIEPGRPYYYATDPASKHHAAEVAWFEKHGVIPQGARMIEAFCEALRAEVRE